MGSTVLCIVVMDGNELLSYVPYSDDRRTRSTHLKIGDISVTNLEQEPVSTTPMTITHINDPNIHSVPGLHIPNNATISSIFSIFRIH